MTLFKYTPIEFIPSCIENGIYASRVDKINDPYEGRGIRYPDQYRVVCLTSSSYQMLMWAYYGNHKGCCIEFDVSGIEAIREVEYVKEFHAHEDMTTEQVVESLYKKGYEWRHEKEYRLVYHGPTADKKLWKENGENVFLLAPVKKIIFGYTSEMDENYPRMLKFLKEYNAKHEEKIETTKCRLMSNRYQLEGDKQFSLEAELQSYKPTNSSTMTNDETIQQSFEEIREEAARVLFRYGSAFTDIVEKPDEKHEEASRGLFEFAEKIKGFLTKKIDNISGIPSRSDLEKVCGAFTGLSHTMYVYKGGDPFRLLEDNARREKEIKTILKIQ